MVNNEVICHQLIDNEPIENLRLFDEICACLKAYVMFKTFFVQHIWFLRLKKNSFKNFFEAFGDHRFGLSVEKNSFKNFSEAFRNRRSRLSVQKQFFLNTFLRFSEIEVRPAILPITYTQFYARFFGDRSINQRESHQIGAIAHSNSRSSIFGATGNRINTVNFQHVITTHYTPIAFDIEEPPCLSSKMLFPRYMTVTVGFVAVAMVILVIGRSHTENGTFSPSRKWSGFFTRARKCDRSLLEVLHGFCFELTPVEQSFRILAKTTRRMERMGM